MVIDSTKRELFRRQQDLFDFAQAYLSEGFPNPERAGCPQDQILGSFARNPVRGIRRSLIMSPVVLPASMRTRPIWSMREPKRWPHARPAERCGSGGLW